MNGPQPAVGSAALQSDGDMPCPVCQGHGVETIEDRDGNFAGTRPCSACTDRR